ncbi:MAG: hypothetical protein AAF191_08515 [Verrucomicrobiota bacterium]
MGLTVWLFAGARKVELINVTPFSLEVCHGSAAWDGGWKVTGWHSLAPGETLNLKARVPLGRQRHYTLARTDDRELIDYWYRHQLEEGDPPVIAWHGEDLFLPVPSGADQEVYRRFARGQGQGFAEIPRNWRGQSINAFSLSAEINPVCLNFDPRDRRQQTLKVATEMAQKLNASLHRQMAFHRRWEDAPVFPYHLGLSFDEEDWAMEFGLEIMATADQLPNRDAHPVRASDMLLAINGERVFGAADVGAILFDHAQSLDAGIEKPIELSLHRLDGDEVVEVKTTYWFEKAYFVGETGQTGLEAAAFSFADGVAIGFYPEAAAFVQSRVRGDNYQIRRWEHAQRRQMLRQWNERVYAGGSIGSVFVSLPRAAVKAVGPRALKTLMGTTRARVVTELTEASIGYSRSRVQLDGASGVFQDVLQDAPFIVGIAIFRGKFLK